MKQLLALLLIYILSPATSAQTRHHFSASGCMISLKNDTLTIENSQIKRTWLWNNGNLKGEVSFSLPSPNSFALYNYRYK